MRAMRRLACVFSAVVVLAACLAPLGLAAADVSGSTHVIDGDTIEIDDAGVRLADIDAPELGQRCEGPKPLRPCGQVAAESGNSEPGAGPVPLRGTRRMPDQGQGEPRRRADLPHAMGSQWYDRTKISADQGSAGSARSATRWMRAGERHCGSYGQNRKRAALSDGPRCGSGVAGLRLAGSKVGVPSRGGCGQLVIRSIHLSRCDGCSGGPI
jgi:hypothetical protein